MSSTKWMITALAAAIVGCYSPSPSPTPSPSPGGTCSSLGWQCGLDDYGSSCGLCPSSQYCSFGRCIGGSTPMCSCGSRVCGVDNCGNSCGTCSSGRTCSAGTCVASMSMPTARPLASGSGYFSSIYGAPFYLPVTSTVCFSSSSSAGDSYNVGIWTTANWSLHVSGGSGARVYAQHTSVTSARDCVTNLPAGDYYLGFDCRNWIENCDVDYAVVGSY